METRAVFELLYFCWSQKYFFAFETNKSAITKKDAIKSWNTQK